ncbi:hypothetical protein AB0F72_32040 [Actinoplanes sp. NPDC023936]|uniref:hypothetical protein n=1 Tax=Actinoplanes sp. NPDC023936 TaxID=3154910 RepID=UPI0033ED6362
MTDDDLRARIRQADPAASWEPASPDEVARLLEKTMIDGTTAVANKNRASKNRAGKNRASKNRAGENQVDKNRVGRRRHYALAAAALVLIAAAGAGWIVTQQILTQQGGADPVTVRLTGPGGIAAKCVEPTAARLAASADLAIEGTVAAVTDSTVTIDVTRVFHGADADRVEVAQAWETSEQLMGTGAFETGKDYFVASSGGTVMICGYSGEASAPGLRDLYEQAFPR